jgi:arylsulfatase A-like enzyme
VKRALNWPGSVAMGEIHLGSEHHNVAPAIAPRAVVISFDHLHLGYVGCYGNDWIETPNLDRLASQAVVFDQHFSENIDPAAANHAWWTGRLQFPLIEEAQRDCRTWLDDLHKRGIKTHLIVESDGRDDSAIAPRFENVVTARGVDGFDVAEGETPFARTVKEAGRWLQSNDTGSQPAVLWIKSRGVPAPWVPPRAFTELYLDEFGLAAQTEESGEPDDGTGEIEPDRDAPDPDETAEEAAPTGVDESLDWRYAAAMYAAYVTLVDRWLGKLLQLLDESPEWKQALLIVTAGAGQALGEHGRLADERAPLRAESVHAPLWIRVPQSDQGGTRRQAMVQTIDVGPTVVEWVVGETHGVEAERQGTHQEADASRSPEDLQLGEHGVSLLSLVRNEVASVRDVAWMGSGRSEWGLRTIDIFYAEPGDENHESEPVPAVLFEKPHDRWDQFDVAPQFRQVSEDMHELLKQLHANAKL